MPSRFEYLLNAMERAAQEENPVDAGYAEKRRAVLGYVQDLEEALVSEARKLAQVRRILCAPTGGRGDG